MNLCLFLPISFLKLRRTIMHFTFLMMSFATLINANVKNTGCETSVLPSSDYKQATCKGNFTEMDNLKISLENISDPIAVFELRDALIEVLPPDIFYNVPNPQVHKVIFDNVSMELLGIPELGDAPLKSIRDTVESFEVYNSSTAFAWNLPSLGFSNLTNFIVEDSELISITIPLYFWSKLRFIQVQNCSLKWIHEKAFDGLKDLSICSLAHNKLSHISRTMFPKPATKLYSLDLSFNRLTVLPYNMFSEMFMLEELKIDNNHLLTIDESSFGPLWDNLSQLWLDGNGINCTSLCWMAKRKERPLFLDSSKCMLSSDSMFIKRYLQNCGKNHVLV